MFNFAWPLLLILLPLPLLMRFLPQKKQAEQTALFLPTFHLLPDGEQLEVKKRFPWLWLAVWVLLVTAAAKPQWLGEPVTIPQEGRELMLAVDLSGSMHIEDMEINGRAVSRLTMLKYVLNDFIDRRVGDRLGLILFGDTAYVQTPLTFDRATVRQMLIEAVSDLVGEKTAIGDALGLAAKRFNDKGDSNRILILLTDGQNTSGNVEPKDALEIAKEAGVRVYTIGVGADEILQQTIFGTRRINPSADLDEGLLTEIASQTGGKYFRARDTKELENIYQILDELEPIDGDPIKLRPQQALFFWPLGLGLLLSSFIVGLPVISQLVRTFRANRHNQKGEDS